MQVVVLDKTGTLTKGEPSVTDVVVAARRAVAEPEAEVLRAGGERREELEHPLGEAIVRGARERGIDVADAGVVRLRPRARRRGEDRRAATVLLGNRKLMAERGVDVAALVERGRARWRPKARR